MFDIFVVVLWLDYVGTSDTVELTLVCTEVCKKIQNLRQTFKDKHGKFVQNPPEILFHQYVSLCNSAMNSLIP